MACRPAFAAFWAFLVAGTAAQACPTCKNALEDPAAHNLAVGMNSSILYMLGTVFLLIGLVIWKIVKEARSQPPA